MQSGELSAQRANEAGACVLAFDGFWPHWGKGTLAGVSNARQSGMVQGGHERPCSHWCLRGRI